VLVDHTKYRVKTRRFRMSKWTDSLDDMSLSAKLVLILGVVVLFVGLIFVMPLGLIWALSTLLSISIGYSFKTWVAAFLVLILLNGGRANRE